jgi:hypothetical protein
MFPISSVLSDLFFCQFDQIHTIFKQQFHHIVFYYFIISSQNISASFICAFLSVLCAKQSLATELLHFLTPAMPFPLTAYAYSVAAPAIYAAPAMPVREATLTKVIHTPGHAVSYCVD